MIDLAAVRARAAARAEAQAGEAANSANPANWLTVTIPISQLATLATVANVAEARRDDVLARLLRWGWPRDEAEATAERIARRASDDDRRTCAECAHHAPGRCKRHRLAGLLSGDVGRDLAALPQRCAGFAEGVT